MLAAVNGPLQSYLAETHGNNYSFALTVVIVVVLLAVAEITALGREAYGFNFEGGRT